jgi:hypothetical protein
MIKYLVAPTKIEEGRGELDFCHTKPLEPLVIGSKCDSGFPADSCGCRRSFSGIKTRKATTIGVVREVDATPEELAKLDVEGFLGGAKGPTAALKRASLADIRLLMRMAERHPLGTRLSIRVSRHGDSDKIVCAVAGISPNARFGV